MQSWKGCVGVTPPWVRIPSPLSFIFIYPSFLLKVLPARVRVIKAIIIKGIKFVIMSSIPMPLRNIPRVKTIKNLTGFNQVKYCSATGISSIGEIKPDNRIAGIINVIADRIACCCVLQIAEI